MWLCCAKMAGEIEILCGMETLGRPKHIVLDGGWQGERVGDEEILPTENYGDIVHI